jgi:hypothetical protein
MDGNGVNQELRFASTLVTVEALSSEVLARVWVPIRLFAASVAPVPAHAQKRGAKPINNSSAFDSVDCIAATVETPA